jgi:hypothetical protein
MSNTFVDSSGGAIGLGVDEVMEFGDVGGDEDAGRIVQCR